MPRRNNAWVTVWVADGLPIDVVTLSYPRHWPHVFWSGGVNWPSS
jgi:hypothetical protein